VPTRSILMYLAHEAIIEDNVFHRVPMPAILIQCPDHRWALQNFLGRLTVRDNVFHECGSALVRCAPQVERLSPDARLYGELRLADNLIVRREGGLTLLDVRGFEKVRVDENLIELGAGGSGGAVEAQLRDCKDVELAAQRLCGVAGAPKARCDAVASLRADGWDTALG